MLVIVYYLTYRFYFPKAFGKVKLIYVNVRRVKHLILMFFTILTVLHVNFLCIFE